MRSVLVLAVVDHVSKTTGSATTSTIVGVFLSLLAQAVLLAAAFAYVFYDYCEDYCDKPVPAHTVLNGLHAALPFGLVGLAAMVGACYLLMRHPRTPRPSIAKAWLMGVWFTMAFLAGIPAVGWIVSFFGDDNAVGPVVVVLFLIPLWTASHLAAARRAGRPTTDRRLRP
jgi:hypothetical protein